MEREWSSPIQFDGVGVPYETQKKWRFPALYATRLQKKKKNTRVAVRLTLAEHKTIFEEL